MLFQKCISAVLFSSPNTVNIHQKNSHCSSTTTSLNIHVPLRKKTKAVIITLNTDRQLKALSFQLNSKPIKSMQNNKSIIQ